MVEKINGGDNSTYSEKIDLDKSAINIHGGMEHNLVGYAKYYSCGSIEILGNNEFTRKPIMVNKIFLDIGKQC